MELSNENVQLKKQLKKSKEKIDALIQQNIKLNQDMRGMEDLHKLEVERLKGQLEKYKSKVNMNKARDENDELTTKY